MRTVALWRFDEPAGAPAYDAGGIVGPLIDDTGLDYPDKDGVALLILDGTGLQGADIVSGDTLLTRDCTIQAIITIDPSGIIAANTSTTGTIYARGKGTGAAEYVSLALQIDVINETAGLVSVRALWQTTAGVTKIQDGAHFLVGDSDRWLLLTMTRRWVSSTEVVLRYYLGDQRIGEAISVDGDIGGGTTGTTSIGARFSGVWDEFFGGGRIDDLKLTDYEMSQEEIEATYLRLSLFEADGYRQMRDALPRGFPISSDPTKEPLGEIRHLGASVGFVDAQTENFRRNFLPDRAYDPVLAEWEAVTKEPARPGDSLDTRRARVVAHFRRHAGSSPPGVEEVLTEILDVADGSQLEQLSFDNTIRDDFSAGVLQPERWLYSIPAGAGAWSITSGSLKVRCAAGSALTWDGSTRSEASALLPVDALPSDAAIATLPATQYGVDLLAKLNPTTSFPDGSEAGIWLYDFAGGGAFFFGLRRVGAAYQIGHQRYVNGVASEAWVVDFVSANVVHWLLLRQQPGATRKYTVSWSTTGPTTGYSSVVDLAWTPGPGWMGLYHRTTAALGADSDVRFDDVAMRVRHGKRPNFWYVFRDPALGGSPDYVGAQGVVRALKQAHTHAYVITSKSLLCDDPSSVCDGGPMGGL